MENNQYRCDFQNGTHPAITENRLKKLSEQYKEEIKTGNIDSLPNINVRYVVKDGKFGYAFLGEFFFYNNEMYVFEKDDRWKDVHQAEVVMKVFNDPCEKLGYAHKVMFAGVFTNYLDTNGEEIYTGDVIQVEMKSNRVYYWALSIKSLDDYEETGNYAFMLDNCSVPLDEPEKMTRMGTVFYQLDWDFPKTVNQRCFTFQNIYGTNKLNLKDRLLMARYTPCFEKEFWAYKVLETIGAEYNWRN